MHIVQGAILSGKIAEFCITTVGSHLFLAIYVGIAGFHFWIIGIDPWVCDPWVCDPWVCDLFLSSMYSELLDTYPLGMHVLFPGQQLSMLSDSKQYVQGVVWDPLGQYVITASSDR